MRKTVGISQKIKRAWLNAVLDHLVQTTDGKELRAFVDKQLRSDLPGPESRAKASGIVLRIWSGIEQEHLTLRNRAVTLVPLVSGQERIWLHWGMASLAYPFFRDLTEVVGRLLALQDDFTTAQAQTRMVTAWGDRTTSKEAVQKLITSFVDWDVLQSTRQGHFRLDRKMQTAVGDLQLWLLEVLLRASAADEVEVQQLLRLPGAFPFTFTASIGDLRKHEVFDIHRQGLDMDMVALRNVMAERIPKPPANVKKVGKSTAANRDHPSFFDL
jgi:hypothetical protein